MTEGAVRRRREAQRGRTVLAAELEEELVDAVIEPSVRGCHVLY
jgi:hypothetical protein